MKIIKIRQPAGGIPMVETVTVMLMMFFAVLAIQSRMLIHSIIHLAVFSLLGAFLYLLFAAPELALAEAAIGSGLVTLLYLASLKRNKVYTIAVLAEGQKYRMTDAYLGYMERLRTMKEIREFFQKREFEPQVVFSEKPLQEALEYPAFDLIITEDEEGISAHGSSESFILEELEMLFRIHGTEEGIRIVRHELDSSTREVL
jgi:putative multicomponent Na+:H+ antiporter subunit B